MLDWLWARIIATILFPIHMLAKKLVYSKIHSAIGISKVLYCLPCFIIMLFYYILFCLFCERPYCLTIYYFAKCFGEHISCLLIRSQITFFIYGYMRDGPSIPLLSDGIKYSLKLYIPYDFGNG
jgi:hypothetical protein